MMGLTQDIVDKLTKGLSEYNPLVYNAMDTISISARLFATAIIFVLFMMKFMNSYKFMLRSDGKSYEFILDLMIPYIVAWGFAMGSTYLINGLIWVGNQFTLWANNAMTNSPGITAGANIATTLQSSIPWYLKAQASGMVLITNIAMMLSSLIANILIFIRFMTLYIMQAVAPIFIAFSVHEETKSISITFLKHLGACILQSALIVIVLGLIPALATSDIFTKLTPQGLGLGGVMLKFLASFIDMALLIIKQFVILFLLIGTQGMAKRWLGV